MEMISATRRLAVLQDCHAIELASFELYTYFAHLFRADPEVASIWEKAAREEENHAAQFVTAASIPGDVMARVLTTPLRIAEARDELIDLLERVKADPPDLEEALEMAVRLERRLADLHMDCVMEFCHEPFNQVFRQMMEADLNHVSDLEKAHMTVTQPAMPPRSSLRALDDPVSHL